MKKSQSLIISFIAILVILIIFIQLFISEYNNIFQPEDKYEKLREEAVRISRLLTGTSSPYKWSDAFQVQKLGLLYGGVIHEGTLEKYSEFSYSRSKILLSAQDEYIFFLKNDTGVVRVKGFEYWGWNGAQSPAGNGGENLSRIENAITAKSPYIAKEKSIIGLEQNDIVSTVTLVVYIWTDPAAVASALNS